MLEHDDYDLVVEARLHGSWGPEMKGRVASTILNVHCQVDT